MLEDTTAQAARIASYSLATSGKQTDVQMITQDVSGPQALSYVDPHVLAAVVAVKHQKGLADLSAAAHEVARNLRLAPMGKSPITRKQVHDLHVKQVTETEETVATLLAAHFRDGVREIARGVERSGTTPDPNRAREQAHRLVASAYDTRQAHLDLVHRAAEVLPAVFARGAQTELELGEAVMSGKQTTAEQVAERIEIDPSDLPFGLGPLPEWLLEAARAALKESFAQDYWQEIPQTTASDIMRTLERGIEEGLSLRRVAALIMERHGEQYSKSRAMLVARTETPDLLNAGHSAGIAQLEQEVGIPIGKEWLSVMGNTSRDDHVAADGQQTRNSSELFQLAQYRVPWPAHFSLPPEHRCNCQCTVLSAPVLEQLS